MALRPILILGGNGQVGRGLLRRLGRRAIAPTRGECDLGDAGQLHAHVLQRDWAAIVNAAAFTAVDAAEGQREAAARVNAEGPAELARLAAARGIPLLHLSTDYVFDGKRGEPFSETDACAPLNVYGATKLAGELGVQQHCPHHVILRTAWLQSSFGRNFINAIIARSTAVDELGVVADTQGNPTSADDVAAVVHDILNRWDDGARVSGTFHCTNEGSASWYELAQHVFACRARLGMRTTTVKPLSTQDYPQAAVRPRDSRLDGSKLAELLGRPMRPWQDAIEEIVVEIVSRERDQ